MRQRVVRGGSQVLNAVSTQQWWNDHQQDALGVTWSNPRDYLRLVDSSFDTQTDGIQVLAGLEAENRALRDRVVELALTIQALRLTARNQHSVD